MARAQGNYASIEAIAADVEKRILGGDTIGVIFPILSRNRFAVCLRGIATGVKKIYLMFSYPSDEVGNELVSLDQLDEAGVNPYERCARRCSATVSCSVKTNIRLPGVDYVQYYG